MWISDLEIHCLHLASIFREFEIFEDLNFSDSDKWSVSNRNNPMIIKQS